MSKRPRKKQRTGGGRSTPCASAAGFNRRSSEIPAGWNPWTVSVKEFMKVMAKAAPPQLCYVCHTFKEKKEFLILIQTLGLSDCRYGHCQSCAWPRIAVCVRCGQKKQVGKFNRINKRSTPEDLSGICKECESKSPEERFKQSRRRSYQKHIEKRRAYGRNRYRENIEEMRKRNREQQRRWHHRHPEEARKRHRDWAKKHPAWRREYVRDWRRRNPERAKEQSDEQSRRRRALKLGLKEDFSSEQARFCRDFQRHACVMCGATKKLALDHWLPLSKGHPYSMSNAVVMCRSCNAKKCDRYPVEMYDGETVNRIDKLLAAQAAAWKAAEGITA